MGRDEEFTALARGSQPRLLRLACLLLLDRHEAEDLVQDALVRVYLSWRRIREKDKSEAYVRRTLVRLAVDRHRARHLALVPLESAPEPIGPDTDDMASQQSELFAILRELPPKQRQCLVLRFYADLPVSEVAEILNCSTGTVKSQTHDAVNNVRRLWARDEVDNDERRTR